MAKDKNVRKIDNVLKFSNEFMNSLTKMEKYKLPIIFLGDIAFICSFFLIACFLTYEALSRPEYLPVAIVCLLSVSIYITSMILIKKEKIYAGAMAGTIGILFACLLILVLCPASTNSLVFYRSGCFAAVMGVCNQAVSIKRRQIKIFNICIFILWIAMIARTVPYTRDDMVTTISSIGINSLGVFIALLLISSINKFNIVILEGEIKAQQETHKNLVAITQVIEASKAGLSVGQTLVDETKKAENNISTMDNLYSGIIQETDSLSNGAITVSESSASVLEKAEQMKNTAFQQNTLITDTSNALLTISGNISNLSNIAEKRSANMKNMLDTFSAEKTLIKKIVDQVQKVQISSAGIAGFVKTVNTIANQTNLLAMNASIEAAHAGVVGKGFSVIAQEIRKLSIQTTNNAAQITEELNKNAEVVQATADSVKSFEEYIQNTTQEMEDSIAMIEHLLEGIQQIDTENGKVMESLKDVVTQSNDTNNLADGVATEVLTQDQILTTMRTQISDLKKNIDAMNLQLSNIKEVINNIDTEAEKNISVSKDINKISVIA